MRNCQQRLTRWLTPPLSAKAVRHAQGAIGQNTTGLDYGVDKVHAQY
jgi:hypothetical protein